MGGDLVVTQQAGRRVDIPPDACWSTARRASRNGAHATARPVAIAAAVDPCAEDNPYGRVVMNTILRELGHRVDFVETGEAAVAAVTRGSYDAVLMDVTLAGLDGIEATRRIRALPGTAGRCRSSAFPGIREPR